MGWQGRGAKERGGEGCEGEGRGGERRRGEGRGAKKREEACHKFFFSLPKELMVVEDGTNFSHNVNPLRVQVCLQNSADGRKPSVLEQVCEKEEVSATPPNRKLFASLSDDHMALVCVYPHAHVHAYTHPSVAVVTVGVDVHVCTQVCPHHTSFLWLWGPPIFVGGVIVYCMAAHSGFH